MLTLTYRILLLQLGLALCNCLHGQAVPYTWEWAEEAYTNNTEFAHDAAVDPLTGDLVVVGEFTGDISAFYGPDFASAVGGGFVAKYNSAGTVLWAFRIGGNNDDRCKGVAIDAAGNIYVTGYVTNFADFRGNSPGPNVMSSVGGRDVFIAKYTSAGMYLWAKLGGGTNDDEGEAIAIGGSTVYVTGYYHNAATFGSLSTFSGENQDDIFLVAYDLASGNEIWLADAGATGNGYGYDVVADVNSVYITGSFRGSITFYNSSGVSVASPFTSGNWEGFTASYTNTGGFNWASMVTGGGENKNYSLTLLASNIYITGGIDNNTSFTGYPSNPVAPSGSNTDFFIAQLDAATGTAQWVVCEPGNTDQEGLQIANDGTNIIACGYFESTMSFATGPTLVSLGNFDVFVAKYSQSGSFIWAQQAGGGDKDVAHALACNATTEIYVAGEYKNAATFGTFSLFNENTINIFAGKLTCPPIANNTISAPQTICIGQTPSPLAGSVPTGGSIPYNYLWEESLDNLSWSPAFGVNTTQNYSPPALIANTYYRRRVTSSGGCLSFSNSASLLISVDLLPSPAAAGLDQTLCSTSTSLLGNTPTTGSGTWTLVSGSGMITTPSSPSSGITAMSPGANIFQWTITSGTCPSSSDQVTINVDPLPTTAAAGVDQTICASSTSLLGNSPTTGNGTWTLVSGSGTITTPTSPTSGITAMSPGANIFQWTITSGTCPASSDQVTINVDPLPTTASAGLDQTICSSSTSLLGNTPTTGTGTWTFVSGSGTITTPSSPTSGITAMSPGANIFQWTITSGTCPASSDQVTINVDPLPTTAAAGVDQTICASSTAMLGNAPTTGTGLWTQISGPIAATITTPASNTTTITGMTTAGAYVFQWTISSGTCPASSDQVTINVDPLPTTAAAGVDQTICASSTAMLGNAPTTGTGLWTQISGPIAATITTPASNTTTITGMTTAGAYVFQWTISSGTCPASSDQVTINVDPLPTAAAAGVDQTICASSTAMLGNAPTTGTGLWTQVSGPIAATITTPASNSTTITGMTTAGAYVFQWTISSGTCPASSDQVTINVDPLPTTAAAGVDQTICASSTAMLGNAPTTGTGLWTQISGPIAATITTPASNSTTITGMTTAGAYVFQWTISSGTCPASSDQVTINVDPLPTTASAGLDQTLCSSSTSLLGNTPTTGNGIWTLVSGSGTITTPSSPTSGITAMSPGANIFQWTITSGTCPASLDTVIINVDAMPTVANAGTDQTLCSFSAVFAGNTPLIGNGDWTLISGTGVPTTPTFESSAVTALSVGANSFQWEISNGTCPTSLDTVIINVDAMPTVSSAGTDQTLCSSSAAFAGNTPLIGNGLWTLISGTGTPTTPTFESSAVTALTVGPNSFQWSISNGTCPTSLDTVTINVDAVPTVANAGPDQTLCSSSAMFAGNIPLTGIGTWRLISGTGVPTTPTLESSAVTALSIGANSFEWLTTNGTCPSSADTVTINVDAMPTVANAGPDQTLCASSATLAGNTALIGTASWTLLSGSGTVTTPTSETSGITAMLPGTNIFQWMISNGTCPSSSDTVIIIVDATPTVANAGPDQTLCSSSVTLAGNPAITGNGLWSLVSGTGSLTTPTIAACGITGMSPGVNIFEWTISNGTCPSSADTVIVNIDAMPTNASAGGDQTLCSSSSGFGGNTPIIGNGIWTLITGTGTVTTPNFESSPVTGLSVGTNSFVWTISNGTCPSSADTVTITVDAMPTVANAGPDQTLCSSVTALAANTALSGTGTWSLIDGTGSVSSPNIESSAVISMSPGVNIFQWMISNGTCPSNADTVIIDIENPPSIADAGPDQVVDHPFFTLQANAPVYGTGAWEIVSGTLTLPNPSDPNCSVGDVPPGVYTFRWVISGSVCGSTADEVTITVSEFLIPNGFSPNQDGINDYFVIPGVGYWENFNLTIYNRWGQLVYQNTDYRNEWNGQSQDGETLIDDTYYYNVEIPLAGKYSGFVVIKRE